MLTVLVSASDTVDRDCDLRRSAFDDQTSTFIIPSGAGFEVVFCPGARSTNILGTSMAEMQQLSQQGKVDHQKVKMMMERRQEMFRKEYASPGLFSRWLSL